MMRSAYTGKVPFSSKVRSDVKLKFGFAHASRQRIGHCVLIKRQDDINHEDRERSVGDYEREAQAEQICDFFCSLQKVQLLAK